MDLGADLRVDLGVVDFRFFCLAAAGRRQPRIIVWLPRFGSESGSGSGRFQILWLPRCNQQNHIKPCIYLRCAFEAPRGRARGSSINCGPIACAIELHLKSHFGSVWDRVQTTAGLRQTRIIVWLPRGESVTGSASGSRCSPRQPNKVSV